MKKRRFRRKQGHTKLREVESLGYVFNVPFLSDLVYNSNLDNAIVKLSICVKFN